MDARKLSPEGQADLRRRAVAAVEAGMSQQEAARVFGISRRAVGVWVRAHRENGPDALNPHRRGRLPGDQYALSRRQQAELLQDVAGHPPDELGLASPVWSRRVLADHIAARFGLHLSTTTVGHYLTRWGLLGVERRTSGFPGRRAAADTVRLTWHRPVPLFVGTALVPGPGAVAAGPEPGWVGPPRNYLDVLFAHTSRGASYFLCLNPPYTLEALQDFALRVEGTEGNALTFDVGLWPTDQTKLLRAWRSDQSVRASRG